jgi:glycerate-2-kinase
VGGIEMLKFSNRSGLISPGDSSTREDLLDMVMSGLEAIDPYRCVKDALSMDNGRLSFQGGSIDLFEVERVIVVGTGKATVGMAKAIWDLLQDHVTEGYLNVLEEGRIGPIVLHKSTHPHPSEGGREGAMAILDLCEEAGRNDLVISLITGGGSAMMPLPPDGISIDDKRRTSEMLMRAGADIGELNTVRKHLSLIKGGQMAAACYPARVLSLILSDVVGDPMESICSGPTSPDPTTFLDAVEVLRRKSLWESVPSTVRGHLERGEGETPKPGSVVFERVTNLIVGNNRKALEAVQSKARERGYNTLILSSTVEGEAREVGKILASVGRECVKYGTPLESPAIIIAGGETTVTVTGDGRGGRNSELVLGALHKLVPGVTMLSFGTDGVDGRSVGGGALADMDSLSDDWRDFMERNDSVSYFEREGGLMITGPTGTNVGDMILLAVRKE